MKLKRQADPDEGNKVEEVEALRDAMPGAWSAIVL